MRIFLYEYACAGAGGPAAAPLIAEGWAMLAALLEDFGGLAGATVETMFGREFLASGKTPPAGVVVHEVGYGEEKATFRRLAAAADRTLVVAPECDDVLPERLRWVEAAGGRSLGSTVEAARLAGDKLRLAGLLRERSAPTPYTVAWPAEPPSYPAVCKPRRGAGSQATFLVRDADELRRAVGQARAEGWGDLIVQPFVPGEPASVAFLVGPGRRLALPAVSQRLSDDGRFHYRGGRLPLTADSAERAASLAARAVDAVEGLRGYVGVDLVLGPTAARDAVMEINPRMTTSYIGLRARARFNLAQALLSVAEGLAPLAWEWGTGQVCFTADRVTAG